MTKVKVFLGTIVSIGILIVAAPMAEFLFRSPAAQHNGKDEESLTLIVKFSPENRRKDDRVFVEVWVDKARIIDEWASDSWVRQVQLAKGRKVTLQATMDTGTDLHCYIQEGMQTLSQDHRAGPGDVGCGYRYVIRP